MYLTFELVSGFAPSAALLQTQFLYASDYTCRIRSPTNAVLRQIPVVSDLLQTQFLYASDSFSRFLSHMPISVTTRRFRYYPTLSFDRRDL